MSAFQDIYEQYFIEASFLWVMRALAVRQPNYYLTDLQELDRRIDSHLDGLLISLDKSWPVCEEGLEIMEPGEIFTAAVIAFRSRDLSKIQKVVEAGLAGNTTLPGLISAIGWLPPQLVHEWIKNFLHSKELDHKHIAIMACSIRRENPGEWLNRILQRDDCQQHQALHCRSLRLAGELRRQDLADLLNTRTGSEDTEVRFWALWSSVLLGNRTALSELRSFALQAGPFQAAAIQLLTSTLPILEAQRLVAQLAQQPEMSRQVITASGWLGDPYAVNWLIGRMQEPSMARIAGEAFSNITGIDLEQGGLTSSPPADAPQQPNDDIDDEDVAMDPDENLPWPDIEKVRAFWMNYGSQFLNGRRYFLGGPIDAERLKQLLPVINQRQRHQAALELALIDSTTPYLNVEAKTG